MLNYIDNMAQGNFTTHATVYTPAILAEICQRIATGEPLEAICRAKHIPHADTIHRWIAEEKIPNIARDIARARERGYDALAEQSMLVAKGVENYSTGDVNRDKLVVDTTLKLLSKWSKRYADKQQIELTGKDGAPLSLRLVEMQQRLLKDITPQIATPLIIEHSPGCTIDDII